MRASLLGLELRGATARLTVVDRGGAVLAKCEEPLDGKVGEWWRTHPEERYRGVLALLEKGLREGLLQGGQVAAIGLSCDPGLVLLDRDFKPIPPRDIPWDTLLEGSDRTPRSALQRLREAPARWPRHVGVVMSVLDFVRFRMTGSLATHHGFAFALGLTQTGRPGHWDFDRLASTEIAADAFPPVFATGCKVGVISEEVVERTGISHGIWVNGGCTPTSGDLFLAADPRPGTRVIRWSPRSCELWEVVDAASLPSEETTPYVPGMSEQGAWYHCLERLPDTESGELSEESASTEAIPELTEGAASLTQIPQHWFTDGVLLDFRELGSMSLPELPAGVRVPCNVGEVSPAAGIGAGIALGWWRDTRGLWRKSRAPRLYSDWRSAILQQRGV